MLRELSALQALTTAGGLRSVHRDPREEAGRTTGGRKLPDVTPLERASDGGDLRRARFASRVLARCPGQLAETLRWLADRAHAGDGDWPRYLAAECAPVKLRDRARKTAERLAVAEVQRAALKGALTKRSRKVTAAAIRDGVSLLEARTRADDAVTNAHREACDAEGALRAWGTRRLTACAAAWAKARREVLREMGLTLAEDVGAECVLCVPPIGATFARAGDSTPSPPRATGAALDQYAGAVFGARRL